MVSERETRDYARYALATVRQLAAQGCVAYANEKVEHQIEDLGYTPEAVCNCLRSLEERDFHQSVKYPDRNYWLDIYLIRYRGPTGHVDDLYVKFKLANGCVVIMLESFHRERWI